MMDLATTAMRLDSDNGYELLLVFCCCLFSTLVSAMPSPIMHSVPLRWNFDDGLNGWARSTPMEMGLDVNVVRGSLVGTLIPSTKMAQAYVDSPELRVEIDPAERDHLVLRMEYLGQCERASIAFERSTDDVAAVRNDGRVFHDPVTIPFHPSTSSFNDELFVFPIWQHITGTITRIRLYPCIKLPAAAMQGGTVPWSGQTFMLDWVAFAKVEPAPVITRVRGCIDKYYAADSSIAAMNCSEALSHTNGIHRSAAFVCNDMDLPLAATINCPREGGQRIRITGKHFGSSDAVVDVGGVECTDVVHVVPEVELECSLPPAATQWLANPTYPSLVRVTNGQLHTLFDEVPFLTYARPVSALAVPVISNVAAHAIDVNWAPPSDVWAAMTVTGYSVAWKRCEDTVFDPHNAVIVGNVTSTTIVQLRSGSTYHTRVTALTEDYRARKDWQTIDLYGRRQIQKTAVFGEVSALSACVSTLITDFSFPRFDARSLTNISATATPKTTPTLGPSGEIGDQGHFGLNVNGDANIENCNATVLCCDGYDSLAQEAAAATAACTLVCSVTERRSATFVNGRTVRSIPTNSQSALPWPAKVVQSAATANAGTILSPITAQCGPALRLTASASFLTGSAWYPRQMNVREGFDTRFVFRISNPSTVCKSMDDVLTRCRSRGGDGFAFVIQNDEEISLGSGGMELGYGGMKNALAVEFDTWYNYELLDVYENHMSVHVGPKNEAVYANHTYSLGSTTNLPDLTDGAHSVRIVYDPNIDENFVFGENFATSNLAGDLIAHGDWGAGIGTISIFVDDLNSPVLVVPIRMDDTIELNHGRAWVGFTASTGATAYQAQDILSWSFESLRKEVAHPAPFTTVVM